VFQAMAVAVAVAVAVVVTVTATVTVTVAVAASRRYGGFVMRSDEHRAALGFLSIAETDELTHHGVCVLDPHSTLISRGAQIGAGTIIYPSVIIDADDHSSIVVGERCVLYPGSLFESRDGARIDVGDHVQLGPGGVTIHATGADAAVLLGDQTRLTGDCMVGRGAQILGAVSARSVRLGAGLGGHHWAVPDERGAVLKGAGIAEAIVLEQGEVRSCRPSFAHAPTERQSAYHPDASAAAI
jgi:carbonic anhydrase/acetyltransferase-like protein (isoleucine patch superfamily)